MDFSRSHPPVNSYATPPTAVPEMPPVLRELYTDYIEWLVRHEERMAIGVLNYRVLLKNMDIKCL